MSNILELTKTQEGELDKDDLNIKKIVVAVDLSPHSEKTAAYAAAFAKSFGASMTLVHAFAPERITEFTTQEIHEGYVEEEKATERELETLADTIRKIYPDCHTEFRIGDPAEQVCLIARDLNADLIVAASRHPDFLSRLFGLDQAPRILHRTQCPVLVYHDEKDFD